MTESKNKNETPQPGGSAAFDCVVIGGGPAGLTAAYELSKQGRRSIVLEADDDVGGISKTCQHNGYRFDLGGHRFFTKVDYVQELWLEILGDEFLSRPRLSRIHYKGKMFDYPLKPLNALTGLGLVESARIGFSYAATMIFPRREEKNFEQWVTNRFGKRLYQIFFKTYTEKVWGMPCTEISAEWAGQRIKNLDLRKAVLNAFLGNRKRRGGEQVTSLIERFQYPRHGPGQMWNSCATLLREHGSEVRLESEVTSIRHDGARVLSVVVGGRDAGEFSAAQFLTSMPIRDLVRALDPPPPAEVLAAAEKLRYRDFLTVALIIDVADLFPDNWVYIHSADVHVGRIQNFKNWSPDMVPTPDKTALGLEYFVQEGDELWTMSDEDLIALARKEVDELGLAPASKVEDGAVLRVKKAYPVYDDGYKQALEDVRAWLDGLGNLQLIGRNGQHRYNNQDHSMMTGVFAARNIAGESHDIWAVNVEQDYHEEQSEDGEAAKKHPPVGDRLVPRRVREDSLDELLAQVFARYDAPALGAALAVVLGGGLFLATAVLLLRGGEYVGYNLSLIGAYFLGFEVSWSGALVGLVEAGVFGFAFGWLLARLINIVIAHEERVLRKRVEGMMAMELFEGEVDG